jgi:outer membrane lipoprotein-sorting protein
VNDLQRLAMIGLASLLILGLLLLAPSGGQRQAIAAGPAIDATALLKRIDRNLNPESYEAYKQIINIEPDGRKREWLLYVLNTRQDKVAALFLSPASDKGRSTLRLGENMWLYIPNAGKPIRITSLQSVIGGVFNNADILSVDYAVEYDAIELDETATEYVLHLKAKTKDVAYDRLTMRVTKDRLLPVQIDCLTESSMLIKTLHFKDVRDFGHGIVRPAVVETDSPLYKGYTSAIVFARIGPRTFTDEVFTLTFLPNLESVRR